MLRTRVFKNINKPDLYWETQMFIKLTPISVTALPADWTLFQVCQMRVNFACVHGWGCCGGRLALSLIITVRCSVRGQATSPGAPHSARVSFHRYWAESGQPAVRLVSHGQRNSTTCTSQCEPQHTEDISDQCYPECEWCSYNGSHYYLVSWDGDCVWFMKAAFILIVYFQD